MAKVKAATHSIMMAYMAHRDRWNNCTLCEKLCDRKRVVLYRGSLPCDVLIIGEAPGETEDTLGYPMIGPTKDIVTYWMRDAGITKYGVTNILACRPPDNRNPTKTEAANCQPRLDEIVKLSSPKMIVAAGVVAQRFAAYIDSTPICKVGHPAFIVRQRNSGYHDRAEVEQRRCAMLITKAWQEVSNE